VYSSRSRSGKGKRRAGILCLSPKVDRSKKRRGDGKNSGSPLSLSLLSGCRGDEASAGVGDRRISSLADRISGFEHRKLASHGPGVNHSDAFVVQNNALQ